MFGFILLILFVSLLPMAFMLPLLPEKNISNQWIQHMSVWIWRIMIWGSLVLLIFQNYHHFTDVIPMYITWSVVSICSQLLMRRFINYLHLNRSCFYGLYGTDIQWYEIRKWNRIRLRVSEMQSAYAQAEQIYSEANLSDADKVKKIKAVFPEWANDKQSYSYKTIGLVPSLTICEIINSFIHLYLSLSADDILVDRANDILDVSEEIDLAAEHIINPDLENKMIIRCMKITIQSILYQSECELRNGYFEKITERLFVLITTFQEKIQQDSSDVCNNEVYTYILSSIHSMYLRMINYWGSSSSSLIDSSDSAPSILISLYQGLLFNLQYIDPNNSTIIANLKELNQMAK